MTEQTFPAPLEPARLIDWWNGVATRAPGAVALIDNGRQWTFAQLESASAGLARGLLAQGAGKGTRIGLLFPNRAEWVIGWLAVSRIGGLAVTLSTFFAPPELAFTLHHADVAILLCAREYLGHRYDERLAAALPGLAACRERIAVEAVPHLRSVWFDGPVDAPWAAGTLEDLAASAEQCAFATPAMLAAVEAAVVPADLALVMYTSGSTAMPKGVVHTQANAARKIAFMAALDSIIPFETRPGDRPLINSPLFWVGGFLTAFGCMELGAVPVFADDHSPAGIAGAIRGMSANSVSGGEGVLRSIRELDGFPEEEIARLRPQNSAQIAFFERLGTATSARVTNSIGMTETFGPHSGDHFIQLPPEIGRTSCGFPLEGAQYRIVDPATGAELPRGEAGELCVRALWLMDGFYKRERRDCFDTDGFYHTGDICRHMPDGRLDFEARHGGMIKTSGANVSPEEVELVLFAHPEIVEAAVFGMPDRERDEIVVAVVAVTGESTLDEAGVKQWVKQHLSAFKVPRRVIFRTPEELPRTPSQKVRKPALRDMVSGEV